MHYKRQRQKYDKGVFHGDIRQNKTFDFDVKRQVHGG